MRVIIFDSEKSAQQACDKIDVRMREMFQAAGFIADAGGIVGKRLSDNADMVELIRTATWAEPQLRDDGSWFIAAPDFAPFGQSPDFMIGGKDTVADYQMQDLIAPIVEISSAKI